MSLAPLEAPAISAADFGGATPAPESAGIVLAPPATPAEPTPAEPQVVQVDLNGQPYTQIPLTPEAVRDYVQKKEAYIQQKEMEAQIAMRLASQHQIQQQPVQPQGDPVAVKRADISRKLFEAYRPTTDAEVSDDSLRRSLKPLVDIQVETWQESQSMIRASQIQAQFDSEYNSVRATDPSFDLNNPVVQQVIRENPGRSPREHFALYKTYYAPRTPQVPATPAFNGANGAMPHPPAYTAAPQGAAPATPGVTGDSPFVQQQVAGAIQMRCTPAEIASIRQRAIQTERQMGVR